MGKGRLFVVNKTTLQNTVLSNIVSVATPELNGQQWLKTLADIMADMLQIEIGDYIFLWETSDKNNKSRIYGVYRAISAPYYKVSFPGDKYPFKIKVELAYKFDVALDEYDVLNCSYIKTPLWTIVGKKVAGKSRGTSPLSQDEVAKLITLLIGRNPNYVYYPFDPSKIIKVEKPLRIDYNLYGDNHLISRALENIDPCRLCFFDEKHQVKYEKILETIFNQEMTSRNQAFYKQIGINTANVIWYSNYLPYSIEQSEMDYLVIESDDGTIPSKLSFIEFIKTKIDLQHIYRSLLYSKWVNETLNLGESITQPIIICPESYDFINGGRTIHQITSCNDMDDYIASIEKEFMTKKLQVFTYDFSNGIPKFTKKDEKRREDYSLSSFDN